MMDSSRTRNYHISEILYNIYKDNIFHKKRKTRFSPYWYILRKENIKFCSLHGDYQWCSEARSHFNLKETVVKGKSIIFLSWHWWGVPHKPPWVPGYQNRNKDKAQEQLYGNWS